MKQLFHSIDSLFGVKVLTQIQLLPTPKNDYERYLCEKLTDRLVSWLNLKETWNHFPLRWGQI